jgi:hypothetical protein
MSRSTGGSPLRRALLVPGQGRPVTLARSRAMAVPWTELAAVATAAGAGAAWLAASASRTAVARTHRPFVWPDWDRDYNQDEGQYEWRVRLHNDGPGVALDVRWSVWVEQPPEEMGGPPNDDAEDQLRRAASEPIRGMRPGESFPRDAWLTRTSDTGAIEWVVVRFTDSAGVRWQYNDPWDVGTLADPLRRLRKVRGYRSLRWRLWRLRHRPLREAFRIRERPDW